MPPTAEQRLARNLQRRLSAADVEASAEGAGVHWDCRAARGVRSCRISCFVTQGAEYLATFADGGTDVATGRTRSADEMTQAAAAWLGGEGLEALYERFAFIDARLRALNKIRADAQARFPELADASSEVRQMLCDQHELLYASECRSCCVSYYGDNARPDASFRWNETEMFAFQAEDDAVLATLLKSWLCDKAKPSALACDHPWLRVNPVAVHYERGDGVRGELLASWDWMVSFYDGERYAGSRDALAFIARLRESGFDRTLRAGQSLYTLMLSRSRRHGLRDDQGSVSFDFHPGRIAVTAYLDGERETLSIPGVELTPELMALLERLEAQPID